MNATDLPPTCKIADVMRYFQLSRSTIYRMVKSGKLKTYRYGNQTRIKREWVLECEAELVSFAEKEGSLN